MSDDTTSLMGGHFLAEMMSLKKCRSKRASSWDRTGGNIDAVTIGAGATAVLADIRGPGAIRHIFCATNHGDRFFMRRAILRMYWDGEETPSVEVPLGDFFGLGFCETRYFQTLLVATAPGKRKDAPFARLIGLNSYFPMPFKKSARITLENDSECVLGACWYHIDYEEHEAPDENVAYFHAQWRRENPTVPVNPPSEHNLDGKENYVVLEAEGWGNFVGMFMNVDNITGGWYGEGDDMIFIDDDVWPPSIHGTGSEEIFGGAACTNMEFLSPYSGFHLIDSEDCAGKQSMCRFYVNDPVRFQEKIRVTIEHGAGNNLGNDYSSTAFWYQQEPHAAFPSLCEAEARLPRAPEGVLRIYSKELEGQRILARLLRQYGNDKHAFFAHVGETFRTAMRIQDETEEYVRNTDYDEALRNADRYLQEIKTLEP